MKLTLSTTFFAFALVGLLACPSFVSASAGKAKQTEEHESVDIEHRKTYEQKAIEPDDTSEVSRDINEHEGRQQDVTTEHREIRRESEEQNKAHHHDD